MPSIADLESQPQETPLNDAGIEAIQDLGREKPSYKKLQERLRQASELLTEVVGNLNDRAHEEKARYARKRAKIQANNEPEDEEEREEHDVYQNKVTELTREMDTSMRGVVDNQVWLKELPQTLKSLRSKPDGLSQPSQLTRPIPTQNTIQANGDIAPVQDDMDIEQEEDRPPPPPNPSETPTAILDEALGRQQSEWNSKSLTDRYSHNNDYVGFYRVIYDAKNPGENVAPIPHPSLWFASEENQNENSMILDQNRAGEDQEDNELEIASERVRIKCPITLLPFKDPVTSDKCHHSYERSAISDMLKTSSDHAPWTEEQQEELSQFSGRERTRREFRMRIPQVKCPECNVSLTESDLKPNPVLLRKVKRILEAQTWRETANSDIDEDENEANIPAGSQKRPVGLESSPAPRSSAVRIKNNERADSVIPQTQLSSRTRSTTPSRTTRNHR